MASSVDITGVCVDPNHDPNVADNPSTIAATTPATHRVRSAETGTPADPPAPICPSQARSCRARPAQIHPEIPPISQRLSGSTSATVAAASPATPSATLTLRCHLTEGRVAVHG